MCTAEATFFYGVFVKVAYLCFASDSYKANKKALFAIDLICSRRRKGQLATVGSTTALLSVPYEVWEMIKLEVIDTGMKEAEKSDLEDYFGEDAEEYEMPKSWDDLDPHEHCFDTFTENSGTRDMLEDRKSDLRSVLTAFGLALPLDCPYSKDDCPHDDPFSLSAVSLPLRKTGSSSSSSSSSQPFSTLDCDAPVEGGTAHGLARFTEDSLKLPSDATRRIKHFLTFFRLEPMNPASLTVYRPHLHTLDRSKSATSSDTAVKKEQSKPAQATHESKCCSDPENEPHWHLWVSSRWTW